MNRSYDDFMKEADPKVQPLIVFRWEAMW